MYKTTVNVNGMMCKMCEKHVNDAISDNFEVVSVKADHEAKVTVIESEETLDQEAVTRVITDAGYEVTGFIVETV
jgi:copper chaperone CopZ